MRFVVNGETPTIVGPPRKLEILSDWVKMVRRERLGGEEESSMDERERRWGRRERVVEVFVVLFRDFES